MNEPGRKSHVQWLLICPALSAVAMAGLLATAARPDSHPAVFAFSVSWLVIVVVSMLSRDAFLKLHPAVFRLARWERGGQIYRRAGVRAFSWWLRHSPLLWLNPAIRSCSHRSDGQRLLREMNYAEGAHWVGGLITAGLAINYAVAGHLAVALSFAVLIVPCHVYPVLLQRWNRGRLWRVLHRPARSVPTGRVTNDSGLRLPRR